jgi:hypothetical protein
MISAILRASNKEISFKPATISVTCRPIRKKITALIINTSDGQTAFDFSRLLWVKTKWFL